MRSTLTLSMVLMASALQAQVAKTVVVEHFTNTVCSICASRNPGFYSNLDNQTGVVHMAVHPSSPYTSCLLNQHNSAENDARTQYYGVYGATPRLVIQGDVISASANYGDPSIFAPYLGQTSPASISISTLSHMGDSIHLRVVVTTEASHSLGALSLFVAMLEDTIFYNSPNGESQHYDVFRKACTAVSGNAETLPASTGDSLVLDTMVYAHPDWDLDRIYPLVILQEEISKQVVQAHRGENLMPNTSTLSEPDNEPMAIYPNPVRDVLRIQGEVKDAARVYSTQGLLLLEVEGQEIDFSSLPAGIYILRLDEECHRVVKE